MKKIELEILALSHSVTQSHSFAVVLNEVGGTRRLPIVIGAFEAQAIAVALENMKPSRPLTHDLVKTIFDSFSIELEYIVITKLLDGVFYSLLVCKNEEKSLEIDSRTSDALALAARFDCPIYIHESILNEVGIESDPNLTDTSDASELIKAASAPPPSPNAPVDYSQLSDEALNEELQLALDKEDYEKAARIRDEIKRRS